MKELLYPKLNINNFYKWRFVLIMSGIFIFTFGFTFSILTVRLDNFNPLPKNEILSFIIYLSSAIILVIGLMIMGQFDDQFNDIENHQPALFFYLENSKLPEKINFELEPDMIIIKQIEDQFEQKQPLNSEQCEIYTRLFTITSGREFVDLLLASLLIFLGMFYYDILENNLNYDLMFSFMIITVTFFTHEFSHKLASHWLGLGGRFAFSPLLIFFTLVSINLGLGFAIPGGVFMPNDDIMDKRDHGITSAAGILSDLIMADLALLLLYSDLTIAGIGDNTIELFIAINLVIGVINLVPIGILDGWPILRWNFIIWSSFIGLFAYTYILLRRYVVMSG